MSSVLHRSCQLNVSFNFAYYKTEYQRCGRVSQAQKVLLLLLIWPKLKMSTSFKTTVLNIQQFRNKKNQGTVEYAGIEPMQHFSRHESHSTPIPTAAPKAIERVGIPRSRVWESIWGYHGKEKPQKSCSLGRPRCAHGNPQLDSPHYLLHPYTLSSEALTGTHKWLP